MMLHFIFLRRQKAGIAAHSRASRDFRLGTAWRGQFSRPRIGGSLNNFGARAGFYGSTCELGQSLGVAVRSRWIS